MECHLSLPDITATERLATCIANRARAGDVFLLGGEIGAGKTSFARAFIRARLGADVEVPSPTYTLIQTYGAEASEIWHADLYRLSDPEELVELGIDEAMETAICLVEWPERGSDVWPATSLRLGFRAGDSAHDVAIAGPADWASRIGECLG